MDVLESPRFPERVSIVARMGPGYKTYVSETAAGVEVRDQQWSTPRTQFTFDHVALIQSAHDDLCTFFENRAGRAGAFRVKHPGDYLLTASSSALLPIQDGEPIGTAGVGYGVPVYGTIRTRTYGAITRSRRVGRFVSGRMFAVRGGVTVTIGGAAGNVGANVDTALFTFVADQSKTINTHTPASAHTIVVASAFSPNFIAGNRVYITGVTGTAADILNGRSHEIASVTSATIQTTTDTTGLTASGGIAYYYPQPTETLTASGEFDYVCRFTSDEANFQVAGRNNAGILWQWTGIDLIEVKDE